MKGPQKCGPFNLYNLVMRIKAEVQPLPVVDLNHQFIVTIIEPIKLKSAVHKLSHYEMMVRSSRDSDPKEVVYRLLQEQVISDYNRLLPDIYMSLMLETHPGYLRIEDLSPASSVEFEFK